MNSKPMTPIPHTSVPSGYLGGIYIQGQINELVRTWDAYADAWKALIVWSLSAPSNADTEARRMYLQDVVTGDQFRDWYDEAAGRPAGFNRPPEVLLSIVLPRGSVKETSE